MSKLTKFVTSTGLLALALPMITFAQTINYNDSVFQKVIKLVSDIITALFPVVTAALVLYFAYEVFKFLRAEGDDKAKLRTGMIHAVIALVVWFTLFGIIRAVAKTFGLTPGEVIQSSDIPKVDLPQ